MTAANTGVIPTQVMAQLIRRWVRNNYGNAEANNPSWDVHALAEHITNAYQRM